MCQAWCSVLAALEQLLAVLPVKEWTAGSERGRLLGRAQEADLSREGADNISFALQKDRSRGWIPGGMPRTQGSRRKMCVKGRLGNDQGSEAEGVGMEGKHVFAQRDWG